MFLAALLVALLWPPINSKHAFPISKYVSAIAVGIGTFFVLSWLTHFLLKRSRRISTSESGKNLWLIDLVGSVAIVIVVYVLFRQI